MLQVTVNLFLSLAIIIRIVYLRMSVNSSGTVSAAVRFELMTGKLVDRKCIRMHGRHEQRNRQGAVTALLLFHF